jgi:predicted nucleic acid-binding Zn ribbon protein
MAAPIRKCPSCGKNKVRRLIGPGAGLIFKGSGFYITDYRSEGYKNEAKQGESGGTSTESKAQAKPDAKSDAKPDSKPAATADAKSKGEAKSASPKGESRKKK